VKNITADKISFLMHFRPCPDDCPATLTRQFDLLEPSSVLTRAVNVNDFKACLKVNKATVSPEDLNQFEEFTNRFGVVGS